MTCDTLPMAARAHRPSGRPRLGATFAAVVAIAIVANGCAEPLVDADATGSKYASAAERDRTGSAGPDDIDHTGIDSATKSPTTAAVGTDDPMPSTLPTTTSPAELATTATTLPELLPIPIDPPLDVYGPEPIIELGRLEIPAIGIDTVLYQGIRLTTLDRGPGHWPGSAEPGRTGNAVIGGHRTARNAVFRRVGELQPGDEIIYTTATGRHTYRVSGQRIVTPEEIWIIEPTPTATTTLFACHPPGAVTQRIAVFADLVSSEPIVGE